MNGQPQSKTARNRASTRSAAKRILVYLIVVIAAIAAATSDNQPTGFPVVDVVWGAAFGALITLAASRARRWTWIWLSGIATISAIGTPWVFISGAALLAAGGAAFASVRNRIFGAVVGALGTLTLLHLPAAGFHGLPSLLSALAVVPVLWSAYDRCNGHDRVTIRRTGIVATALLLCAGLGLALSLAPAYKHLRGGAEMSANGLAALRDGDQERAGKYFDDARSSFSAAESLLRSPWAYPSRAIPVVGQQISSLTLMASTGTQLSDVAGSATATASYHDLKTESGQLDLDAVRSMQTPAANSATALGGAHAELVAARSPWLLAPLARRLDDYISHVDDALPSAELASEALDVVPNLLGGDGSRRYLALFTTPAESRFSGGFVGAFAVLGATDGKLTLDRSGPVAELNQPSLDGSPRSLSGEFEEFVTRFGRYNPTAYFQNVTASPDMPTNAAVARELYRQSTGVSVDGVMFIDPIALASLVELTGPVRIDDLDEELTSENLADFLLLDQYIEFPDDNDDRHDILTEVATATFEALSNGNLPGPRVLSQVLSPVTHEGRLAFISFHPREETFFEHLGATSPFEPGTQGDFISLRTANANPNKIDTFLTRTLRYEVTFDPLTGNIQSRAVIEITNSAPTAELPEYVIGNDLGAPIGSNTMYLSLYTPLEVTRASLDGGEIGIERQHESNSNVFSTLVTVPSGERVTLAFDLGGSIPAGQGYQLDVLTQPMVNADDLSLSVRTASPDRQLTPLQGFEVVDGVIGYHGAIKRDSTFTARLNG